MSLVGAKICPLCGTLHSAAARRCLKDGATLEAVEDAAAKASDAASPGLAEVVVRATPPLGAAVFPHDDEPVDDLDSDFDDDFEQEQPTAVGFDEDLLAAAKAATAAGVFDPESADPDGVGPTLVSIDPVTESAQLATTADNLSVLDNEVPEVMVTRETLLPNLAKKTRETPSSKSAADLFEALMSVNPPGSAPAPIAPPKAREPAEVEPELEPRLDDVHVAPTIPEVELFSRGEEEIEVESAEIPAPAISEPVKADEARAEAVVKAPSPEISPEPRLKKPPSGAIDSLSRSTASGAVITREPTDEVLYGFKPQSTGTAALTRAPRRGGKLWFFGALVVMVVVAGAMLLLMDGAGDMSPPEVERPGGAGAGSKAGTADRGLVDSGLADRGVADKGRPDLPKAAPKPKAAPTPKAVPKPKAAPTPKAVPKPKAAPTKARAKPKARPKRRPRRRPKPKRPKKGTGIDKTVDPFAE